MSTLQTTREPITRDAGRSSLATYRRAEMASIFFAGPLLALFLTPRQAVAVLIPATLWAIISLWRDRSFARAEFWNWGAARAAMPGIVGRFLILSAMVAAVILIFAPEMFLSFPRERPRIWALVMLFYPIFSVYPQELVWRALFHHRYRHALPGKWCLVGASASAFALMHVVFNNWVALAMTMIGGVLFAQTYERTRSTAAVWFEHTLYGCMAFTFGLGVYFYAGAVR